MRRLLKLLSTIRSRFKKICDLALKNLALRQQLAIMKRSSKRPQLRPRDRQSSYLLEPGADVDQIRLRYHAPVEIESGGSLRIGYETGQMRESAPVAWQYIDGRRMPVEVTFCLLNSSISNPVVGFSLGRYNPAYPVMIDPTLQWHTFMGSADWDSGYAIAVDGSGNVYMAGTSYATWGSPVNGYAGDYDAFVAKLVPAVEGMEGMFYVIPVNTGGVAVIYLE